MPTPSKISVVSKKEIGQRLRVLRQARGITQARLARLLGTHQTGISQVERGHRGLTLQQVVKLARVLETSTDELLALGDHAQVEALPKDRQILKRMRLIEKLPRPDRQALIKTIDAFLKSSQVA